MQLVDTKLQLQLGKVATASINSGVNSPYPSDTTAPVPSANLSIVSDDIHDLMYSSGNRGAMIADDETYNFLGTISNTRTSGDSGVGSLSLDHAASRLNQEINTRPVVGSGFDDGAGKEILKGALRHWASECGVYEDGVTGDILMGISNEAPGIGYYKHPTKRMLGVAFDPDAEVIQWVPTESEVIDPGFPLDIGESLSVVVGFNDIVTRTLGVISAEFGFTSGQSFEAGEGTADAGRASLLFAYNQFDDNIAIWERREGKADKLVFNLGTTGEGLRMAYCDLKITRTAATTVRYDIRMDYDGSDFTWISDKTVTDSYLPKALAVTHVDMTSKGTGLVGYRIREGIVSAYIRAGDSRNISIVDWQGGGTKFTMVWPAKTNWTNVAIPGMSGNAWQMINDLATTYGLIFDPRTFTIFPPEELVGNVGATQKILTKGNGVSIQTNARERAETVEVVNYDYKASRDIYDEIQLYKADTAYSVALGERQEHIVQTDSTFSLLTQPECVTVPTAIRVQKNPNAGESVYSVYDSDNLEVDPNTWRDGGGDISVEGTGVPGEMKIIIQAPNNVLATRTPPFIISIESSIPSLIISGIGAMARKKTLTVYTGAGSGADIKKVGITYDSPLVGAEWIAWNIGAGLGALYGTSYTTASGNFAQEGWFPELLPIRRKGSYYLPLSVSDTASTTNVSTATRYNSCIAINREFQGKTCADVNTLFAGKNVRYVNMSPLPQIMD